MMVWLGARMIQASRSIDRGYGLYSRVRAELVLALASEAVLARYNDLAYSTCPDYHPGASTFRHHLFPWEERVISEFFPSPPSRVLVGGAGGGREVFALAAKDIDGRPALGGGARRLTPREAISLAGAWFLLAEVDLRLRLTGFSRLQSALSLAPEASRTTEFGEIEMEQARSMARAIRRAARFVPRAQCLHRALALLLWLRRRGAAGELRLGVRASGETIEGHAWVEWHGTPLDEALSVRDWYDSLDRTR